MAYRGYSVAQGLMVDASGHGDFTTIQAAINAASSGQDVFIRPGIYTENPILKAGVNLCSFGGNQENNVIINGTCTFTGTGLVSLYGLCLQTNSAALLAVTGSSASQVILTNCKLNCTNNNGITFSSSNAGAVISIRYSSADLGTTGIKLFAHSSAGVLAFYASIITNSGGSSTASTASAGFLIFFYTSATIPITTSGTNGLSSYFSLVDTTAQNVTALTIGGSGNGGFDHGYLGAGTASALSIGSGTTCYLTNSSVNSSNTNAIAGSGSINFDAPSFISSSAVQSTLTSSGLATGIYGTYTPVLSFGGASVGITYSQQNGYYVRMGAIIYVSVSIVITSKGSSTGTASVSLPVPVDGATHYNPNLPAYLTGITLSGGYSWANIQLIGGSSGANIVELGSGVGAANLTDANFANSSTVYFSGWYLQ